MRKTQIVVALSVLGVIAAAASPTWAPSGHPWKTPAPISYCKTNRAQQIHCNDMYDGCMRFAEESADVTKVRECGAGWKKCCTAKRPPR